MYTVLVIDDSPSMRRILKDMVNSIDEFEVIADAMDAYDAREKIKQYEPDLVKSMYILSFNKNILSYSLNIINQIMWIL